MNKYDRYRMELMRLSNNIQFYKHKIALCQASNARVFYEKLLAKEAKRFQELQLEYQRLDLRFQQVTPQENPEVLDEEPVEPEQLPQEGMETVPSDQRVFTIEELSKYNGTGGQPAYIAVNGIVYDVSLEKRWSGGMHFSMLAGKNLTMNFNTCHVGNIEVLRNLPKVGTIKQE